MDRAAAVIARLKTDGRLSALPIGPVDWNTMTVSSFDGTVMVPYGSDGTWVADKPIEEGDVRYLGSASHAGKIEFKALYVFAEGAWHNILSGKACGAPGTAAASMSENQGEEERQ